MNTLYYGDNLDILRKHVDEKSIDLVYLDPPFNSNRSYNLLFREQSGEPAEGQIKAFTDTWKWSETAYDRFCQESPIPRLVDLLQGFVQTLGRNDVTAYLVMMAPRLVELRRVLKDTGSLYLHCDPTASHYLKVLMDVIFGKMNFRNEIVWSYRRYTAVSNRFQRLHDIILFYGGGANTTFHDLRLDYGPASGKADSHYKQDENGRWYRWQKRRGQEPYKVYLSEGRRMGDVWELPIINASAKERLGYPTQKPLALLERVIAASANAGDVVLDPFCGCGTTIMAAQKLGVNWVGIDITHLAISLIKYRLGDGYGLVEEKDYAVIGEPTTVAEARALALADREEFQKWAIGLIPRARPSQDKKGADRGVDGVLFFKDDHRDPKKCVIQVKSGHVKVGDIRDFRGVIDRERATLGLFVTLESPTGPMQQEADSFGFYTTPLGNRRLTRLQVRTIAQLLGWNSFDIPSAAMLSGVGRAEAVENGSPQVDLNI